MLGNYDVEARSQCHTLYIVGIDKHHSYLFPFKFILSSQIHYFKYAKIDFQTSIYLTYQSWTLHPDNNICYNKLKVVYYG